MRVHELIEKLLKLPQDKPVVFALDDSHWYNVTATWYSTIDVDKGLVILQYDEDL